jgi:hypothetical protein
MDGKTPLNAKSKTKTKITAVEVFEPYDIWLRP